MQTTNTTQVPRAEYSYCRFNRLCICVTELTHVVKTFFVLFVVVFRHESFLLVTLLMFILFAVFYIYYIVATFEKHVYMFIYLFVNDVLTASCLVGLEILFLKIGFYFSILCSIWNLCANLTAHVVLLFGFLYSWTTYKWSSLMYSVNEYITESVVTGVTTA